ncbi:hypothetical protein Bca101_015596 [Brassica carinata]
MLEIVANYVLDTSLVFEYEYSGEPPKKSNRYFETRVEFGKLLPRRPSLDSLCKKRFVVKYGRASIINSKDVGMMMMILIARRS